MVQSYSAGGANVPPHKGTLVPSGKYDWTCTSTEVHNPNVKLIGSAVFAQLIAESPYTLQWVPLSSKIAPSSGGCGPHLTHDSLGPSKPTTQMASRSVQPFLHSCPQSVPMLYNGMPFPPSKVPPPMGDLDPYLIHGFLGLPESSTQMASWSVQPFLQGSLVWLTDRPTDRLTDHTARLVTIGRIYICSKGDAS